MKTLVCPGTLRDYQSRFFVDAMQTLDDGQPGSWLYASPTGSGKSVMELTLLGFLPDFALITPRLEIVAGMLQKGGINTAGWSDEKLAAEALEYRISTPIRFRNMLAAGELPWRPTGIIWDECFPAGTLVDGRPIESLRVGDEVTAVNLRTGPVRRPVTRVFKHRAPTHFVRVTAGGQTVVCTPNHPFYVSTDRGPGVWLDADHIHPGDYVMLQVRGGDTGDESGAGPDAEVTSGLLRPDVRECSNARRSLGENGGDEPQVRGGADDHTQPDGAAGDSGEGVRGAEGRRAQAPGSGRQRPRDDKAGSDARGGDGAEAGRRQHGNPVGGFADALQARLSPSLRSLECRSGRIESPHVEGTGSRPQEGSVFARARVDRVEVLERASADGRSDVCPDGYVYNLEVACEHTYTANGFLVHNCHHRSANSYQDIRAYLGAGIAEIGLTASPFRGTPAGTEEFLASWDSLTWVLSYPDAAARGVISVPSCTIWPLVDDDTIEISNGEIVVNAAAEATRGVLGDIVERCRAFRRAELVDPGYHGTGPAYFGGWDRPTIFAVPSRAVAGELAAQLTDAGLPAVAVTQDTPRAERLRVFAACERSEVAIVQIDVVSEGVDLKLRRLIDLRPTMSPVKWLQQVGRITRPVKRCAICESGSCCTSAIQPSRGEPAPEYICCNRNLERHCYLYEGMIPPAAIKSAQQAFERPSRRAGVRAVGVEGLGRFTGAELPLAGGLTGIMYNLTAVEGFTRTEYAVLLHPCSSQPLYAQRLNEKDSAGQMAYGRWSACEKLPDLTGFASAPPKALSDKQRAWWTRSAASHGLDAGGNVNRRNFAALPILKDLGVTLKGGV